MTEKQDQENNVFRLWISEFTWWVFLSSSSSSSIALFNLYCFSWQTSDPIMLVLRFKSSCLWTTYYSSLITTLFKQSVNQKPKQDFRIFRFWIFPTCVCGSLIIWLVQVSGYGKYLYLCPCICICVCGYLSSGRWGSLVMTGLWQRGLVGIRPRWEYRESEEEDYLWWEITTISVGIHHHCSGKSSISDWEFRGLEENHHWWEITTISEWNHHHLSGKRRRNVIFHESVKRKLSTEWFILLTTSQDNRM